ncbi:MAG: recombination protein RecR [Candidatus Jacksonbacteria bacterium RIFOXYA2_FULL_44_7]|uniref:Recombination protein RecR n=1 Tax=Candidatus Jacksonbacteria bacterium RIFCSPLOWO2_02_FULL_44_20 TaxID=1798460 RepID=A0A1G2AD26_9BACT|nr:MAG: Recombination protein RecR [Parcubacteria group bacterium GW2011_GWC2_44_17]KKT48822.1 MAG: Recombination protein RecR [Parcubacteria group bacterium GW2011_GWF2_44_17]OGY70415.1 MAG: recombination protein RecR [Candidatus Jacksonbacteria bacterium RIFCSPHIGHO2_12_FULL_44_12]OGY71169.1 MAG: recombination protein RecR [Candidatus Jacksonbacteria bacterium RIFCSPHIGHO2_02_FULL_44_25]OGY73930.1 MAG: recombination protein RecR [Candidatus Jacksonbacteria bacterium RIFCSPLOWO2_02_FULL_44_20]
MLLPSTFTDLIREFMRLPGVGPKTSERLVFSLLRRKKEDIHAFARALFIFSESVNLCAECFHFTDKNVGDCAICRDSRRERTILCVISDSLDLIALESAGYRGLYHVIGGVINPLKNMHLKDLRVAELITRLKRSFDSSAPVQEIILGFDPNYEGELTASALRRELNGLPIKITRLARGLPQGGDLDYADEITLKEAIRGRREF